MAVTIHSSPQFFTPSDNPIIWTFSSNQTAQANFSYIVEIYVNGALSGRREIFPEIGARSHIDLMEVMAVKVPAASPAHTTVVKNASNSIPCYIIVRERYGSPPAYHASATSGAIRAFKASLTDEEMQNWIFNDYTFAQSAEMKFLRPINTPLSIKPDKDYFLSFFNVGESFLNLVFNLYAADGTSISGSDISIDDTLNTIQLNLRTSFLVAESIIPQSSFDAAAYMVVYLDQLGGDPISEQVTIYFDREECGAPAHFVWLNRFSGFDVFNSTHNLIYSSGVEVKSYEKQFGEWQGNSYVLDAANAGEIDYLKTTKDKLVAITGYIDDDTQHYIVNMYDSPLVYISGDTMKRVNVRNATYELQNDLYEEEFTEAIEVSLPNIKRSMRL